VEVEDARLARTDPTHARIVMALRFD